LGFCGICHEKDEFYEKNGDVVLNLEEVDKNSLLWWR
jgi:hypothetical protein